MSSWFIKKVRQYERRFIPKMRHKVWYKVIKAFVLLPVVLLGTLINLLYGATISKIRFKRSGKPDIVLNNIIAGWGNLMFSSPAVEQLALKRAKICADCPSAQFSGAYYITAPDSKTKQVRGLKCGECGCALSAKVRSVEDSCPLGKW